MNLFRFDVVDHAGKADKIVAERVERSGVRERAREIARLLKDQQSLRGEIHLSWEIVVFDSANAEVERVPFWLASS